MSFLVWMGWTLLGGCDSSPPPPGSSQTEGQCGDEIVQSGEECDDGEESSECNPDCTLSECGDGVLNVSAGEQCDDDSPSHLCWGCQYTPLTEPTDWSAISSELHDIEDLLPPLPESLLDWTWNDPADYRLDLLGPGTIQEGWTPDETVCSLEPLWDGQRVIAGPQIEGEDPHCRVRLKASTAVPEIINRYPTGSKNVPITGEPGWIMWRFPLPEDHEAVRFSYWYSWSRYFGSHPENCHPDDQDEEGNCAKLYLDEDEHWEEVVPPGVFLLWTVPGDSEGWAITGPHTPADEITWSADVEAVIPIPEYMRRAPELVVTALVYHQYPGGCMDDYCVPADATYVSGAFNAAQLWTRKGFVPDRTPPEEHPRLFGEDDVWYPNVLAIESLPCQGEPDYPEGADWGSVTNVRNTWEKNSLGGASCLDTLPESLADYASANRYLSGEAYTDWDGDDLLISLHLVRRMRACHQRDSGDCLYGQEEIEALAQAVIEVEMARLPDESWGTFEDIPFDLYTAPPVRRWSLLQDVFWDELSAEDHAAINEAIDPLIDGLIEAYEVPHWSLYNGNNWTPVIADGAMFWAITHYHEDPRAAEVAALAMEVMWLHREFYLEDGAYMEGLMMYTSVSFLNLLELNALVMPAFGAPLESVRWDRLKLTADWMLDFIAPDGQTVDFGDSWAKRGWGDFSALYMHLSDEIVAGEVGTADPCFVRRYFQNKYYDWGLRDPWSVNPVLAQDWFALAEACPAESLVGDVEVSIYPFGGWGGIRTWQVGATPMGQEATDVELRYAQADQTFVAVSAVPSEFEHTELDFGTLVWTAYGSRLLWDSGYGSIGDVYSTTPDYPPDNNPTGHNTLVIPEALLDGDPSTNTSQVDDVAGTIEAVTDLGLSGLHLDGALPYGQNDPDLGWLEQFDRWLLHLDGGQFLVIDSFLLREERGEAMVEERWHFETDDPAPTTCDTYIGHPDITLPNLQQLEIEPLCTLLAKEEAQGHARIVAFSLEPGGFVEDPLVTFTNRLNVVDDFLVYRYEPNAPVSMDLRLFALISAPLDESLPEVLYSEVTGDCSGDLCISIALDDASWLLNFVLEGGRYMLERVE